MNKKRNNLGKLFAPHVKVKNENAWLNKSFKHWVKSSFAKMLCPIRDGKKVNQNDYNSVGHNLKTNENKDRGMRTKGHIYISTRITNQENNGKKDNKC